MKRFTFLLAVLFLFFGSNFSLFGQTHNVEEEGIGLCTCNPNYIEALKALTELEEAHEKALEENDGEQIFIVVENPPIFEGGIDNFYKIVGKNLKLDEEETNGIGSKVFIEFVIDTVGKMTDFKILKSNFSEKNNTGFLQTLDFINENYTWKPAIHKGKKVFYRMNLPIIIHLSE